MTELKMYRQYEKSLIELKNWDFKEDFSKDTKKLIQGINIEDKEKREIVISTLENLINNRELSLREIILKEDPEFGCNNLILAEEGSGKTDFLFSIAEEYYDEQVLFLVPTFYEVELISSYKIDNITAMTYSDFGEGMRYSDELINQFTLILCDEVHHLFNYENHKNSTNLFIAMRFLFLVGYNQGEERRVYYVTSEIKPVQKIRFEASGVFNNLKFFNYLNYPTSEKEISPIIELNSTAEMIPHLQYRKEEKRYFGSKTIVFCDTILNQMIMESTLEEIYENELVENGGLFSVSSYWDKDEEGYKLSKGKRVELEKMIQDGLLPEKHDVIILNKDLDSKLKLKDENVKLIIIYSDSEIEKIKSIETLGSKLEKIICKRKG